MFILGIQFVEFLELVSNFLESSHLSPFTIRYFLVFNLFNFVLSAKFKIFFDNGFTIKIVLQLINYRHYWSLKLNQVSYESFSIPNVSSSSLTYLLHQIDNITAVIYKTEYSSKGMP